MNDILFSYCVNTEIEVPIYEQLVSAIRTDIKSGKIPFGTKLPTVRQMSDDCSIARGTVMRAYDELENLGFIEKVQGRGTSVCYREEKNNESRKDSAMASIDKMLDDLEALGFSEYERDIFLNLKIREREKEGQNLKIAVIECNFEILNLITEQLRSLGNIDVFGYMTDEVESYPYRISDDTDAVIVSQMHFATMKNILPEPDKIIKVAIKLMPHQIGRIARCEGKKVGIICQSQKFGELLSTECSTYTENIYVSKPCAFSGDIESYLKDKDAILVPQDYDRFCGNDAVEKLRAFSGKKNLIQCAYEIDAGSMIFVEEKLKEIRNKKPGNI